MIAGSDSGRTDPLAPPVGERLPVDDTGRPGACSLSGRVPGVDDGHRIVVRPFEPRDYDEALQAMREFTACRDDTTRDEIWLVEHPPVYTFGLAGRPHHLLAAGDIPVVRTERGGQITYHGPGQVVAYTMIDLRRRHLQVRELVCSLEQGLIDCLAEVGVVAVRRPGAPGVYVADTGNAPGDKIGALGLKISRSCSFHGVALNVAMDLEPFSRIDPCGYPGMGVTDLRSVLAKRMAAGTAGPASSALTAGSAVSARYAASRRSASASGQVVCTNTAACDNEWEPAPVSTLDHALTRAMADRLARHLVDAIDGAVRPTPHSDPESP